MSSGAKFVKLFYGSLKKRREVFLKYFETLLSNKPSLPTLGSERTVGETSSPDSANEPSLALQDTLHRAPDVSFPLSSCGWVWRPAGPGSPPGTPPGGPALGPRGRCAGTACRVSHPSRISPLPLCVYKMVPRGAFFLCLMQISWWEIGGHLHFSRHLINSFLPSI